MKRAAAIIFTAILLICFTVSCGSTGAASQENGSDKLKVVTTIFPIYDWVRVILGSKAENAELTMLLDNGADLHSYQPTVTDMAKIADCDIFIYVGGESDEWVEDALKEAANKEMTVINLLETLGDRVREEELAEGMEADEDDTDEETGYDEHVWLSLKNAVVLCDEIASALGAKDVENVSTYTANAEAYKKSLKELDSEYEEAVASSDKDTLIFGDRFPFRYLTDDYGLKYYAAFAGCSAETEASFETVVFLANKLDELKLNKILVIENSDYKLAQTIRDNTTEKNQEIVTMNSMQSITADGVKNGGVSYLGIMEDNLKALKIALE